MKKLKVCGMKFAGNIAEVAALRPDYLGFIFYEKSSRYISEVSAELIKYIPAEIKTVGVFVDEDLEKVQQKVNLYQLKAVQLHGSESPAYCSALKAGMGSPEVIKAFGIDEEFDFTTLETYQDRVDFFLFDTKTDAHGGSGRRFDWTVLNRYEGKTPYFLSGGIDVSHAEAIKTLNDERLYALDINSRFEVEPGRKDVEKIKTFINAYS